MNKINLFYVFIIIFILYKYINKKETYINYGDNLRLSNTILKYLKKIYL